MRGRPSLAAHAGGPRRGALGCAGWCFPESFLQIGALLMYFLACEQRLAAHEHRFLETSHEAACVLRFQKRMGSGRRFVLAPSPVDT